MRKRVKWLAVAGVVAAAGCGRPGAGSGGGSNGTVTISGSTTVTPLSQAWAEDFMKTPGRPSVTVSSGGSGVGITALINGTTDIAQASRAMKPDEVALAKSKGFTPAEIVVAQDGLSVIVNKANPIGKLTFPQLSGIFTGKAADWSAVGGKAGRITIVSRDKSSGSYDFFLNHVLRAGNEKASAIQYSGSAQQQQSNQAIVAEVSRNPNAIGYVGLGYTKDPGTHTVDVAKTATGPYVRASVETVLNRTYPISRPLFYYTRGEPAGNAKTFIAYVTGPDGQATVGKMDFVPVKK